MLAGEATRLVKQEDLALDPQCLKSCELQVQREIVTQVTVMAMVIVIDSNNRNCNRNNTVESN